MVDSTAYALTSKIIEITPTHSAKDSIRSVAGRLMELIAGVLAEARADEQAKYDRVVTAATAVANLQGWRRDECPEIRHLEAVLSVCRTTKRDFEVGK